MRLLSLTTAAVLITTGCASTSYTIPRDELVRLSMTQPEQRAARVLVSQELTATDVEPANEVGVDTDIIWTPRIQIGGSYSTGGGGRHGGSVRGGSGGGGGHSGGKGGGLKLGSGGGDGKAAAVAIVILAAVALVAVAGVEGSRFDGWVQLHPMHPVHLIGRDGSQSTVPLAWIDPQAVAWADKAIIRSSEGPWRALERKPLTRGGTYAMYGGYASSRSVVGDVNFGPSFTIQGGYFPVQQVGLLATVSLGWRDNQFGGTLYDSRYVAELQALPLQAGKLHGGFYAGYGLAYRWEDVPGATIAGNNGNNGSTALTGGAQLQLELHTRIALTARFGAVKVHGDRATDMLVGIAVY